MESVHSSRAEDLQAFDDPGAAFERIREIYLESVQVLRSALSTYLEKGAVPDVDRATYPYLGVSVAVEEFRSSASRAYGILPSPGSYGATLTRPDLFKSYYLEQLAHLSVNHKTPLLVGRSFRPIPLPFVIDAVENGAGEKEGRAIQQLFPMPELHCIDDTIANGTYLQSPDMPGPLTLFEADRVDYSLLRLSHYTGTTPEFFQRFILFTNYQRYVEEFIEFGLNEVREGENFKCFVGPGNEITHNPRLTDKPTVAYHPSSSPQMPAYHLMRDRHMGITLVNIGVGPSNAKTITDHIAVLRPHCWIMVGHCGGLRETQHLGDYVLAHAYGRSDNVLNEDLPPWVPVPPIAEVQVALQQAVAEITGLSGSEMKQRMRTGTVFTTDDRDWELRRRNLSRQFHLSRAIAVDMESATIAANGYRFRVPYGTLLCVSDKPLHGELKMPGMANRFYKARVAQHLKIGIRTVRNLCDQGVESLHSRKLRSFDEPAFR